MAGFALCIGINDYPGTDMDLKGCVNDANDWAAELTARGLRVETLLDAQATKKAMINAIGRVIADARAGDLVAVTFSGHGTYVFDTGEPRDEEDPFDEALCPHDVEATGDPLIDDEIYALFKARPDGVRLLLIADSCHAGTVTRDVAPPRTDLPRKRFLPPEHWMKPKLAQLTRSAVPPDFGRAGSSAFSTTVTTTEAVAANAGEPPLDDVLLAGCKEGKMNFSYDAVLNNRPNGAFSFFALKALRELPPGATYVDWHAAIAEFLPTIEFPQVPQLVATEAARMRRVLD